MAYITDHAKKFVDTWDAYKHADVDLDRIDTDVFRVGWPSPTLYREHEVIHIMANLLDQALAEVQRLKEAT